MNSQYAVGSFRVRFESQARRRWLVALFYATVAAFGFAPFSAHPNVLTVWIVSGLSAPFAILFIVFAWIAGDPRIRGDERETHRRDHAHYVAYRMLLYCFLAVFFVISSQFPSPALSSDPMRPCCSCLWSCQGPSGSTSCS